MHLLRLLAHACWVSLCLVTSASHGEPSKRVRLATGETPPFSTESCANGGVTVNVLRRALASEGYLVDVLPWSRALLEAREVEISCALATQHFKPAEQTELTVHSLPFMVRRTMHAMLPKNLPGSPALLAAVNRGLACLRTSGKHISLTQGPVACPIGWLSPQ